MSREELSRAIDHLHQALHQDEPLDDEARSALQGILADIQVAMNRSESEPNVHLTANISLKERLLEMITDFEIRHPQLTSTLTQISDRLSDMGI